MKIIMANWKMTPPALGEARRLCIQVEQGLLQVARDNLTIVLAPPFVFLPLVQHCLHLAHLGAQNVSAEEQGPYTGEISATQLQQFNVEYVIIGHSERRALGESDKLINQKIKIVMRHGIYPILCVGFGTKKGQSVAAIKTIIKKQLRLGLSGIGSTKLTIAYEPVWAISRGLGTGKAATPKHVAEIAEFIKSIAPQARIIYGGSVDAKNAASFANENIQGALVGGASLVASEFLEIIKAFS